MITSRTNARKAMAGTRVSLGYWWREEAIFKSAKTRKLVSGRLSSQGRRQAFWGPSPPVLNPPLGLITQKEQHFK